MTEEVYEHLCLIHDAKHTLADLIQALRYGKVVMITWENHKVYLPSHMMQKTNTGKQMFEDLIAQLEAHLNNLETKFDNFYKEDK